MRKLIILGLTLFLIASCKKHADNQLRILIRNGTDSIMTVKLYPKIENMKIGKYIYSDINLIYKDTTFVPFARLGTELYVTKDITIEPQMLASKIFDSINISMSSGKRVMRFSPQRVVNCSRNLFTDKSAWTYEKNQFELVKMWRDNFIESDDYIFVVTSGI
jgi:hypothetical protein